MQNNFPIEKSPRIRKMFNLYNGTHSVPPMGQLTNNQNNETEHKSLGPVPFNVIDVITALSHLRHAYKI